MEILEKIIHPIKKYFQTIEEIEALKMAAYGKGCDETSQKLSRTIQSLTSRIEELTKESLAREKNIQTAYTSKVDLLQDSQLEKCKNCMLTTEAERDRLRKRQNLIADLIERLTIVFTKLSKHEDLVLDAQENILRNAGRVRNSKEVLLKIREEFDILVKEAIPLLAIEMSETPIDSTDSK